MAALEDPGTVQAAYYHCPTGNNPEVLATPQTMAGPQKPLRQGTQTYGEPTDMYHGAHGVVAPAVLLADAQGCGNTNPDEPSADQEGHWT